MKLKKWLSLTAFTFLLFAIPSFAQSKPAARRQLSVNLVKTQALATGTYLSPYTTYVFTWTYSSSSYPTCPSNGALLNCLAGFTLTDTTDSQVIATAGSGAGQIPSTSRTFSYSPSSGIPYGSVTFTMVAVGYDSGGNVIQSTPASTTIVVGIKTIDPPTGFTGTSQ